MRYISFFTEPGLNATKSFYVVLDKKEQSDQIQHKALSEGYLYHGTVMVQDNFCEVKGADFIQKDWKL